ncbi:MAG: hypothetical protein WAN47_08885 [Nitrosotalea sp.]
MNTHKKSLYAVSAIAILVVTAVVFESHDASVQNFFGQKADAQQPASQKIPFALNVPDRNIVLKAGQSTVIPVGIFASPDALQAKIGVTLMNDHLGLIHGGQASLPAGISATLDKTVVNLPSLGTSGITITKRDTTNLSISVSQDTKPGMYLLTIVMFEGDGKASGIPLNLEVQQ